MPLLCITTTVVDFNLPQLTGHTHLLNNRSPHKDTSSIPLEEQILSLLLHMKFSKTGSYVGRSITLATRQCCYLSGTKPALPASLCHCFS